MSNQRKSRPHLEGFLLALAIFGVILLVAWNHSANAADLANEVSTAAVIDPEESPWYVSPNHKRLRVAIFQNHREMGVQLERALDVAFDEIRKIDQSRLGVGVKIYLYRHDNLVVEVSGSRIGIGIQFHERDDLCLQGLCCLGDQ